MPSLDLQSGMFQEQSHCVLVKQLLLLSLQKQFGLFLQQQPLLVFVLTSLPQQFLPFRFRLATIVPATIVIGVIGFIDIVHPVCFCIQDSREQSFIQCRSSGLCHMTLAECDARSAQLTNVAFSSLHGKQVTIDRNIAMSLPMCIGNAGVTVVIGPCSSDHPQQSTTVSTACLGSQPARLQIWAGHHRAANEM